MQAAPEVNHLWILTSLLGIVGLILLRYGLWPRRRGTTPRCRRCEYNLTGLDSDRCPECGARLTFGAIVHGERRRRPGRIVAGGLCWALAIGLFLGSGWLQQVNWYRFQLTAWVLSDLQSPNNALARRAWNELQRRDQAKSLSAADASDLIDQCLWQQLAMNRRLLLGDMLDYVGRRYLDGQLSESQQVKFFKQSVMLQIRSRPRVMLGDGIPIQVHHRTRGPNSPFWNRIHFKRITGESMGADQSLDSSSQSSGPGGGGSVGISLVAGKIGSHTFQMEVEIQFFHGTFGDPKASRLHHSTTRRLETTVEVVESDAPDHIRLIKDAAIRAALEQIIQPERVTVSPNRDLDVSLRIDTLPIPIAFDIVVRIGNDEHAVGAVYRHANRPTWSWNLHAQYEGPPPTECDVILRSNPRVARSSIDLIEIWDGELVYEGVPVVVAPR